MTFKVFRCSKCSEVSRQSMELQDCSDSDIATYCSKECQRAHWKRGHKKTCGLPIWHPVLVGQAQELDAITMQIQALTARGDFTKATALGPHALLLADRMRAAMPSMPVMPAARSQLRDVAKDKCASLYSTLAIVYAKLHRSADEIEMQKRLMSVIPEKLKANGMRVSQDEQGWSEGVDRALATSRGKVQKASDATRTRYKCQIARLESILPGHQDTITVVDVHYKLAHLKLALFRKRPKMQGGKGGEATHLQEEAVKHFRNVLELTGTTENWHVSLTLLHLAVLEHKRGDEESSLHFLQRHLENLCRSKSTKSDKHPGMCAACGQSNDFSMRTCSCCMVARFCNVEHQKAAWKKAFENEGSHVTYGGHKYICKLLKRWKLVEQGSDSIDSCRVDMLAFLTLCAPSPSSIDDANARSDSNSDSDNNSDSGSDDVPPMADPNPLDAQAPGSPPRYDSDASSEPPPEYNSDLEKGEVDACPPAPRLIVGTSVRIHSLKGAPQHNGLDATLLAYDAQPDRWHVRLNSSALEMRVRPSNVVVVASTPAAPPSSEQVQEAISAAKVLAQKLTVFVKKKQWKKMTENEVEINRLVPLIQDAPDLRHPEWPTGHAMAFCLCGLMQEAFKSQHLYVDSLVYLRKALALARSAVRRDDGLVEELSSSLYNLRINDNARLWVQGITAPDSNAQFNGHECNFLEYTGTIDTPSERLLVKLTTGKQLSLTAEQVIPRRECSYCGGRAGVETCSWCPKCKVASFCEYHCMAAHWKEHQAVCSTDLFGRCRQPIDNVLDEALAVREMRLNPDASEFAGDAAEWGQNAQEAALYGDEKMLDETHSKMLRLMADLHAGRIDRILKEERELVALLVKLRHKRYRIPRPDILSGLCSIMCNVYKAVGRYAEAATLAKESLLVTEQRAKDRGYKKAEEAEFDLVAKRSELSLIFFAQAKYEEALELQIQCVTDAKESMQRQKKGTGTREDLADLMGSLHGNVADTYSNLTRVEDGIAAYRLGLDAAIAVGNQVKAADLAFNLSSNLQAIRAHAECEKVLLTSLDISKRICSASSQGTACVSLGLNKLCSVAGTEMDPRSLGASQGKALSEVHAEAEEWFTKALAFAQGNSKEMSQNDCYYIKTKSLLHLARVAYMQGKQDAAVETLSKYLGVVVEAGRSSCAGCGQVRGQEGMLTCGKCGVARYCCPEHQRLAAKAHNKTCALLKRWRHVGKGREKAEACRADTLAWLAKSTSQMKEEY